MSKIEIKKISIIESQTDCIVNAANEVAVAAYLKGLIGFYDISRINEKCLRGLNFVADPSIEDIFETNAEVARIANGCIS